MARGRTVHSSAPSVPLTCRLCGQEHDYIPLKAGEKARCVRCEAVLAQRSRLGPDTALVFSLTTLALAFPAMLLPFVTAGKLGEQRESFLFTGVASLWAGGMRTLAILVFLCGGVLPLLLAASLALLHAPPRFRPSITSSGFFVQLSRTLQEWAIPEVQVLAVLVALVKLGRLVNVTIGPGFWCYCAMTLTLLVAQRSFNFESTGPLAATHEARSSLF